MASVQVLLVQLLVLVGCVAALFQDQAGVNDWTLQHVGPLSSVYWPEAKDAKTVLVASTETDVIASLNTYNGKIEWRQVFQEQDELLTTVMGERAIATLSFNRASFALVARAWNVASGKLFWEAIVAEELHEVTCADAIILALNDEGKARNVLYVATASSQDNHLIAAINMDSGRVRWSTQFSTNKGQVHKVSVNVVDQSIFALLQHDSTATAVISSQDDGKVDNIQEIAGTNGILVGEHAVVLTPSGVVRLVNLKQSNDISIELKSLIPWISSGLIETIQPARPRDLFLLKNDEDGLAAIIRVSSDNLVTVVTRFKGIVNAPVFVSGYSEKDNLQLAAFQTTPAGISLVTRPSISDLPSIVNLELKMPSSKRLWHGNAQLFAFRPLLSSAFLVAMEDGHVAYLQSNQQATKVRWTREESLANVIQAEFIELPKRSLLLQGTEVEDEIEVYENSNVVSAFIHRISHHAAVVETLVNRLIRATSQNDDTENANTTDTEIELSRDPIGTRKIVLLLTSLGRVVALSTWDAQIRWSQSFVGHRLLKFVLLRAATTHDPVGVIISNDPNGHLSLFFIDPVTGEGRPENANPLPPKSSHLWSTTLNIAATDHSHVHALLVVDSNLKAFVVPETVFVLDKPIHFPIVNSTSNEIAGYRIVQKNQHLLVEPVWSSALESNEVIAATAQHDKNEHVVSIGRVLGDRQVMYKYLNPHLIAIATIAHNERDGVLRIRLIDSVSGLLVDSRYHSSAQGPVTIAICEHWVVYSFVNTRDHTTEVSVLELFEDSSPDHRLETSEFSSLDFFIPHVLSQSYILSGGVTAASVTQTRRGVTSRLLLYALSSSRLLGIPKRMIDPRRPVTPPTAEEKEEMLIPYAPVLPIENKAVFSYNQTIARVRFIQTAPALLESTSLVLAVGLDLFFTRLTPSQTFDSLTDEFQYSALIFTLVGLLVVTAVAAQLARRKAIADRWK